MDTHPDIMQKYSNLKLEEIQFIIQIIEDFGTDTISVSGEVLRCLAASASKHETKAKHKVWECDQTLKRISKISYSLKIPQPEN